MRLAQYLAVHAARHAVPPLPLPDRAALVSLVEHGLPSPTYARPVWHRGWRIWHAVHPIWPSLDWVYEHPDHDAEDESDDRHGLAGSLEAARGGIDQWIAETPPAWCDGCEREGFHAGDLTGGLCFRCHLREGEV